MHPLHISFGSAEIGGDLLSLSCWPWCQQITLSWIRFLTKPIVTFFVLSIVCVLYHHICKVCMCVCVYALFFCCRSMRYAIKWGSLNVARGVLDSFWMILLLNFFKNCPLLCLGKKLSGALWYAIGSAADSFTLQCQLEDIPFQQEQVLGKLNWSNYKQYSATS